MSSVSDGRLLKTLDLERTTRHSQGTQRDVDRTAVAKDKSVPAGSHLIPAEPRGQALACRWASQSDERGADCWRSVRLITREPGAAWPPSAHGGGQPLGAGVASVDPPDRAGERSC